MKTIEQNLKDKIIKILIFWHLPTKQGAISEIIAACEDEYKAQLIELLGEDEPDFTKKKNDGSWTDATLRNEFRAELRKKLT